jgi:hypothetical protein
MGQLGGWKNRRRLAVDVHVPENLTIADLSTINAQAMRYVLSGDLEPRAALALVQMSSLQLRLVQGFDHEARLTLIENQMAEDQAGYSTAQPEKEEVAESTSSGEDSWNESAHTAMPAPPEREAEAGGKATEQTNQQSEKNGTGGQKP